MPYIEERGENTWRLVVEDPASSSRNRLRRKRTIKVTDAALLKAPTKLQNFLNMELVKFQMEVEKGQYVKVNKVLFEEFITEWKRNYADVKIGAYTRKNYMSIVKSQLIPEFGGIELTKIKTIHIINFFTKLRTRDGRKDGKDKPLATNTLLNIYNVLKTIFDSAKSWDYITTNPMEGVERPVASKKEKREMKSRKKAYTPEEARQALLIMSELPHHWRIYFIGVLIGGFRRGEMLGVEWPSVYFDYGGIMVEKQITYDETGRTIEGEVKTIESEAFVPMPHFFMRELEEYKRIWGEERERIGPLWKGGDKQYLFHNGFGEMLHANAPTQYWGRLMKKSDLPRVRLHDLRHTTAALLREEHADMKSIQERLRHARLETTSNIYTHESEYISRYTADLLDKYDPLKTINLGPKWGQIFKKI